jgi:phosphatidate cytidylyltransferase
MAEPENAAPLAAPAMESLRARLMRSDLWIRVASGVVLAALALAVAWLGGPVFDVFWIAAGILIFWEWKKIVAAARFRFLWMAAGAIYGLVAIVPPILLRHSHDFGLIAILFLFGVVWATDVGGYIAGRLIGGPKIWPAVSPKKTWAGTLGGIVAAILAGSLVSIGAGLGATHAVLLSAILSVAAQAGDFLESAFKRRFGVKDASHIIPGHGGVMDRLDGFLVAALIAAAIGLAHGGWINPGRGLLVW